MIPRRKRDFSWFQKGVRTLVFGLVRLFYPRIEVMGLEKLPAGGVILVANHPNGLFDPAVIMTGLQWDAAFLAKSTIFSTAAGRYIMKTFGALPVYRQIDSGPPGGPQGDLRDRNEETFAICRALLRHGGALALFPEGTTHSNSQLLPLRSGAARIALGAAAEAGWSDEIHIVPIGLWYEAKTIFRSSVLVVIGEPLGVAEYRAQFTTDPFLAARAVTRAIRERLDTVLLQAEDAEVVRAIPIVAGWLAPLTETADIRARVDWSQRLLTAYRVLRRRQPERVEALAADVRYYADALRRLGLKRPLTQASSSGALNRDLRRLSGLVIWLALTSPIALAGFITTYPTYRLARPFARLVVAQDRTQISTVKLLGGALFVLLGWIIEAVLVGGRLGMMWGWLLLLLLPFWAYVGLLWGERLEALLEIIGRHGRYIFTRGRVDRLEAQRQRLISMVMELVHEVEGDNPIG